MKGQLLGQGNTAEVYAWDENRILKLFRQEFPVQGVEKEYLASKAVEKLGVPVPKVGQMIELEGRKGIIYERISGSPMMELMVKHPLKMVKYSKQMAELHYRMHQCEVQELPKYKEALEWNIRHTEFLTEKQKSAMLDILEKLPEGNTLCHCDFHPGNIISTSDRSIILDWMTATSGNSTADVARTLMLMRDSVLPEYMPAPIKLIMKLARKYMVKVYLKRYQSLSGLSKKDIAKWRLPIIAARLTEWIPEKEKNSILKEINKAVTDKSILGN